MIRAIKIALMAAVMAAVVVFLYGRRSHAESAQPMTAAEHMEHLKMMAAGGDIHAGHALDEFARGVADQLAAEGFIAVAPDIVSGHGKDGGDTASLSTQQEITQAVLALPAAEITSKLKAAREFGLKDSRSNGKSASVGFCFGGAQSFAFAVAEPGLNAAVVYYGQAPTDAPPAARGTPPGPYLVSDRVANVKAPIIGFYGGLAQDARIGNTVAPTEAKMKELGKTYEPHIFDGAAHGFLRAQTGNAGANMKATEQAWPMTVAWLKKYAG